jgi:hypothetical protein
MRMQKSLLLFSIVSAGTILIQSVTVALHFWHKRGRYEKQVIATIKQVQIWIDGWYVTAVWTDVLTGKSYTFHSGCVDSGLEPLLGERVIVHVDPKNFKQYQMML